MTLLSRFALARAQRASLALLTVTALLSGTVRAADHTDPPQNVDADLGMLRLDAQITDFLAWVNRAPHSHTRSAVATRGLSDDLVAFALSVNPFIAPLSQQQERKGFRFPSDVKYTIHVDNHSEVTDTDSDVTAAFGGVIPNPEGISSDLRIEVTFQNVGPKSVPKLEVHGGNVVQRLLIWTDILARRHLFTGYRADAFNFAPVHDRNTASIVLDVHRALLLNWTDPQDKILVWATTEVIGPGVSQDESQTALGNLLFREHGGRALRSQSGEFTAIDLNALPPAKHTEAIDEAYGAGFPACTSVSPPPIAEMSPQCGFSNVPDVIILDTASESQFPNGRRLSDNVIDQVAVLSAPYVDDRIFKVEPLICDEILALQPFTGFGFTVEKPCAAFVDNEFDTFPGLEEAHASETKFPYLGEPHLAGGE